MSPRKVQLLLFAGIGAIALHFSIKLGVETLSYFSLEEKTKAIITQWEIVPVKDKFALRASYTFGEHAEEGVWPLNPPYYLNELAAFHALKTKAKESWEVWYDPKSPSHSVLEKKAPWGLFGRTLICYCVLIYFLYLYKITSRV